MGTNYSQEERSLALASWQERTEAACLIQAFYRSRTALKTSKTLLKDPTRQSPDFLNRLSQQLNNIEQNSKGTAGPERLTSMPAIPVKAPKQDPAEIQAYLDKFLPEYQGYIANILKQTQYISWPRFNHKLQACIAEFNTYLLLNQLDNYEVVISPGSSTQWVLEQASRYLKQLPSKIYVRDKLQQVLIDLRTANIDAAYAAETHAKAKNNKVPLVIFDDWVISAEQLGTNLQTLRWSHSKFILVIPYMTKFGKARLLELAQRFNIEITIFSNGILKSLHLMDGFIKRRDPSKNYDEQQMNACLKALAFQPSVGTLFKNTVSYSDWKTPDTKSSFSDMLAGRAPHAASIFQPYTGQAEEAIPENIRALFNRPCRPIPQVEAPYAKV